MKNIKVDRLFGWKEDSPESGRWMDPRVDRAQIFKWTEDRSEWKEDRPEWTVSMPRWKEDIPEWTVDTPMWTENRPQWTVDQMR